jgi:hypothetical protein
VVDVEDTPIAVVGTRHGAGSSHPQKQVHQALLSSDEVVPASALAVDAWLDGRQG